MVLVEFTAVLIIVMVGVAFSPDGEFGEVLFLLDVKCRVHNWTLYRSNYSYRVVRSDEDVKSQRTMQQRIGIFATTSTCFILSCNPSILNRTKGKLNKCNFFYFLITRLVYSKLVKTKIHEQFEM